MPEQCHLGVQARTWLVHVEKVNHKFYFQDGWKEFVHENGLKGGEVLVFFYAGNAEFSVDIYGKNACKKMLGKAAREESDCLRSNYVGSSTEIDYSMKIPKMAEADDSSVEILDDFPPCPRRTGEKSSLTSHRPHKKNSTSSSGKTVSDPILRNETTSNKSMKHKETHCHKPGLKSKEYTFCFPCNVYLILFFFHSVLACNPYPGLF